MPLSGRSGGRCASGAEGSSPTSAGRRPPRIGRPGTPGTCPCAAAATPTTSPARKPPPKPPGRRTAGAGGRPGAGPWPRLVPPEALRGQVPVWRVSGCVAVRGQPGAGDRERVRADEGHAASDHAPPGLRETLPHTAALYRRLFAQLAKDRREGRFQNLIGTVRKVTFRPPGGRGSLDRVTLPRAASAPCTQPVRRGWSGTSWGFGWRMFRPCRRWPERRPSVGGWPTWYDGSPEETTRRAAGSSS